MKNYKKPEIKIVEIETECALNAASDIVNSVEGTADFSTTVSGNTTTDEVMSKGHTFDAWDGED